MSSAQAVIEIRDLTVGFGSVTVLNELNFTVNKGEVVGVVGGSGSGKTTLLRSILALNNARSGSIKILGNEVVNTSRVDLLKIQRHWGVLFQQNALFSSLNILDNVAFPLHEHTKLDKETMRHLAMLKILMAGLPLDAAYKYPSELSGGMQKRAGLARAIVLDPELIFLDEPTAGLDPNTAAAFDELILNLQQTMGLTIVMITHDMDSLWKVTNRVAYLGEGRVLANEPINQLVKNPDPAIHAFFNGPRGIIAQAGHSQGDSARGE